MKKLISFICAIVLILPSFVTHAAADGIGTVYMNVNDTPSDGLEYSEIYADSSAGRQIAYTYTFTPGYDTKIAIGTAGGIFGRSYVTAIANYEISKGNDVIGSVNGNTFSIQSGVTDGILISDGKLLSWNGNSANSIGISSSGNIVSGTPDISISLTYKSTAYQVSAVNKWSLTESGICLFTNDFAASTKSSGGRIELIIRPNNTNISLINQKLTCTVVSVGSTADTQIPNGCIAISMPSEHKNANTFKGAKAGETITVTANSSFWKDITFATGTDKKIVDNGKAVNSNTVADDKENLARTAIGIKNDGKLILFACDGDGKYGCGLTTANVSSELISMGVKTAYYLDCGSSTTVTKNGSEAANHPADGEEKLTGSSIVFINGNTNGKTSKLLVTPSSPTVLNNGFIRLSCVAADAGGDPTGDALSNITYSLSSSLGTVSGPLFKAGGTNGNVTVTAKATCNGKTITGSTVISVIDALDNIKAEESTVYVPVGGKADIKIMGTRSSRDVYLYGYALKWSFSGVPQMANNGAVARCKYGYLDNNLVFHAEPGYSNVSFTLIASFGYATVPVKVIIGKPDDVITDFDDNGIAFTSYLKTDTGQSYKYSSGKFQTNGLEYSGKSIIYKSPEAIDRSAKSLSLWIKGSITNPYATVELNNGERKDLTLICSKDYSAFNGWKKYTVDLPDDAKNLISPLSSKTKFSCTVDEITISYGTSVPVFADISSSWAKKEIDFIYEIDVTAGYGVRGSLTYKPQSSITRAEFTKMIVTYYGLKLSDYKNTTLNFNDIGSIPSWALPYVKAAVATGIIQGSSNPDGTVDFLPNDKITRAQVAAILGRKLTCSPSNISFKDNSQIPAYALDGLKKAVTAGVLSGYPDGTFKPNGYLTRAEVAKIIANLYNYYYNK